MLSGQCLAIVEGEERLLGRWDFLHCPGGTEHVLVGAGDGPCTVIAFGARRPDDGTRYVADPIAARHGASVAADTPDPQVAYADSPPFTDGPPPPLPADGRGAEERVARHPRAPAPPPQPPPPPPPLFFFFFFFFFRRRTAPAARRASSFATPASRPPRAARAKKKKKKTPRADGPRRPPRRGRPCRARRRRPAAPGWRLRAPRAWAASASRPPPRSGSRASTRDAADVARRPQRPPPASRSAPIAASRGVEVRPGSRWWRRPRTAARPSRTLVLRAPRASCACT